ncbi:unnamed protein product [Prunus armeniaca]
MNFVLYVVAKFISNQKHKFPSGKAFFHILLHGFFTRYQSSYPLVHYTKCLEDEEGNNQETRDAKHLLVTDFGKGGGHDFSFFSIPQPNFLGGSNPSLRIA